jgi:hypothetical protein
LELLLGGGDVRFACFGLRIGGSGGKKGGSGGELIIDGEVGSCVEISEVRGVMGAIGAMGGVSAVDIDTEGSNPESVMK